MAIGVMKVSMLARHGRRLYIRRDDDVVSYFIVEVCGALRWQVGFLSVTVP